MGKKIPYSKFKTYFKDRFERYISENKEKFDEEISPFVKNKVASKIFKNTSPKKNQDPGNLSKRALHVTHSFYENQRREAILRKIIQNEPCF